MNVRRMTKDDFLYKFHNEAWSVILSVYDKDLEEHMEDPEVLSEVYTSMVTLGVGDMNIPNEARQRVNGIVSNAIRNYTGVIDSRMMELIGGC